MSAIKSESLTGTLDYDFVGYENPPEEPMGLFRKWLDRAVAHEVREPTALALATVDSGGRSFSRIVVINKFTEQGLVFLTHADSDKGRHLAATRWASGVLYWRETAQQITLAGSVHRLPDAECDELWTARPVAAHAMSVASRQSMPLTDVAELRAKVESLAKLGPLPRPPGFGGYHLAPVTVEFWYARPDRLHQRLRYSRSGEHWVAQRLQP